MEALLLSHGLSFPKHSAVIAAFAQHFVRTGTLDPVLHRHLLEAFDLRNVGDYDAAQAVNEEDAHRVLANAREFCLAVKRHLTP